ncbi:MAG: hypothetical protein U1E65_29630 [Myxococcota bacterium]
MKTEKAHGAASSNLHIPSDASKQFLPAFQAAQEFAGIFGYQLSYSGGAMAKEIGAKPVINPMQVQDITLTDKQGKKHKLGGVLPEAKHMGPVKSEAVLEKELFKLVDGFRAKLPKTTAFHANAAAQFIPGIEQASAYAELKGFGGVSFEGSGIHAKGMNTKPHVEPTEVQNLFLLDKKGKKHKLGQILPEAAHIKTLKTGAAVFDAVRAMIDAKATSAS